MGRDWRRIEAELDELILAGPHSSNRPAPTVKSVAGFGAHGWKNAPSGRPSTKPLDLAGPPEIGTHNLSIAGLGFHDAKAMWRHGETDLRRPADPPADFLCKRS